MSWTKQTGTIHKSDCARVFKNYDLSCARCLELVKGATPRAGWSDQKRRDDATRIKAIRNHNFTACSEKNVVCTCFDW